MRNDRHADDDTDVKTEMEAEANSKSIQEAVSGKLCRTEYTPLGMTNILTGFALADMMD